MKGTEVEHVIEFAGLTRHDQVEINDRAAHIGHLDEVPELSFTEAIRELETAQRTIPAWKVPDEIAAHFDVEEFNAESPKNVHAFRADDSGEVYIETNRYSALYSPEKLEGWLQSDYRDEESAEFKDGLWAIPSSSYSITNPTDAYTPLAEKLSDEDLGAHMFGRIKELKSGGEVHIEMLFDNLSIEVGEGGGEGHILIGLQTGYDFFGGTSFYVQGFAKDGLCDNTIRAITDEYTRRHVQPEDADEEEGEGAVAEVKAMFEKVLSRLGLLRDRLAEVIELASETDLDIMSMDLTDAFNHDDNLRAFYEAAGLPSYLARHAASDVRARAENRFMPNMFEMWSGATYALTHEFQGGEHSSTLEDYIAVGNDMVYNPEQTIERVERNYQRRLAQRRADASEQTTLEGETASASIENFRESVQEKRDEFETGQERLREIFAEVEDEDAPEAPAA